MVPQNGWFIRENPIKMGWFRGFYPYFWFNTQIVLSPKKAKNHFPFASSGLKGNLLLIFGGVWKNQRFVAHLWFLWSSKHGTEWKPVNKLSSPHHEQSLRRFSDVSRIWSFFQCFFLHGSKPWDGFLGHGKKYFVAMKSSQRHRCFSRFLVLKRLVEC